jgi:hypothetical protein
MYISVPCHFLSLGIEPSDQMHVSLFVSNMAQSYGFSNLRLWVCDPLGDHKTATTRCTTGSPEVRIGDHTFIIRSVDRLHRTPTRIRLNIRVFCNVGGRNEDDDVERALSSPNNEWDVSKVCVHYSVHDRYLVYFNANFAKFLRVPRQTQSEDIVKFLLNFSLEKLHWI